MVKANPVVLKLSKYEIENVNGGWIVKGVKYHKER